MQQPNRFNSVSNIVTQYLVLAYQLLAAVVFIASLFSAYAWLTNPFIGGFFEQTMVLNESVTREPGEQWALQEAGFRLGDQLVSVAGNPISSSDDLGTVLGTLRVGQTVPVVLRVLDGENREASILLQPLSPIDQLSYFVIPALLLRLW